MNENILKNIEDQLKKLLDIDKKSWVQVYRLMETVEKDQLYSATYRSYTAWVRHLSAEAKIHESVLWSRLKAGRTYQRYADRHNQMIQQANSASQQETQASVDSALEKISPDTLVLVDKIAGNNSEVVDQLVPKVLRGEMTRKDLRQAWASVRQDRAARGLAPARKTRHDASSVDTPASAITAADIILSLSDPGWLHSLCNDSSDNNDGYDHKYRKYRLWQEYGVDTGDTRHVRRMDALIAETYTTDRPRYDIHLHGVEIKVSKSDLVKDQKMSEYTNYVDYFWIAIPSILLDEASALSLPNWGILTLNDGILSIARPAKLLPADQRYDTIMSALIKLL